MNSQPRVALIYSDRDSSRMLREVIRAIGSPISYESSALHFVPGDLASSGAHMVLVDLTPEAEIDAIFDLLEDERYRVIFNDADVTSALSGWEHARWARHLAAKILGVPAVVDPPRPEEDSIVPSMNAEPIRRDSEGTTQGSMAMPTGAELGIDDWLSEVLQISDPGARTTGTASDDFGVPLGQESRPGTPARRKGDVGGTTQETATPPVANSSSEEVIDALPPVIVPKPVAPAAEERFMWNIEDVIRDIDEWLPPADPAATAIKSDDAAIPGSVTTGVAPSESAGVEPEQDDPASGNSSNTNHQRDSARPIRRTRNAAAPMQFNWTTPPADQRLAAPQGSTSVPLAPPAIAAVKGSAAGGLARFMQLTPQEEAALSPLFEGQEPAHIDGEISVDVVGDVASVSRVIVLCASVGGPEAIRVLLGAIPAHYPALFLVVQQVGEEFLDLLSQQLRRATALRIRSADVGDQLRDGEVIPVSPRQRLVIDRSGRVTLNQRMDAVGSIPMNQVLRDVSDHFGADCTAVALSGIASDAADGCRYVSKRGGKVCAQVPASCVSSGMVEQVQKTGVIDFMGTPAEIAAHLLLDRK